MGRFYHLFREDGAYDGWTPDGNARPPAGGVRIQSSAPLPREARDVRHEGAGTISYLEEDPAPASPAVVADTVRGGLAPLVGALIRIVVGRFDQHPELAPEEQAILDEMKPLLSGVEIGSADAQKIVEARDRVARGSRGQSGPPRRILEGEIQP